MNFSRLLAVSLIVMTITYSCRKDDPFEPDAEVTFGIRHDKSLSDYEAAATSTSGDVPNFSAVISLDYSLDGSDNYQYTATGTLINNEWILTAGHNFFSADEDSSPASASGIRVLVGNDPNNPVSTHLVSNMVLHPTWLAGDQEYADANDLCLLKLSTPVSNVAAAALCTTKTENIGSKVWFCGYGDYSSLQGQDPDLLSKRHAMENVLDRKRDGLNTSAGGTTYNGGLLAFDFDSPDENVNSLGDDFVGTDEADLGSGDSDAQALDLEGTSVEGDSGGPLFIKIGNQWVLAGVLSGGADAPIADFEDSSYGDISIFTRVSSHIDWINSVIQP